jgi:hypothetical protein
VTDDSLTACQTISISLASILILPMLKLLDTKPSIGIAIPFY